jgi:hypothetical protein
MVIPVYGAAITYGKSVPIEVSNFPKWKEGRHLAYPTSASLALRAEDSLRLFRKLLRKVLSKMLAQPLARDTLPLLTSAAIWVNSHAVKLVLRTHR